MRDLNRSINRRLQALNTLIALTAGPDAVDIIVNAGATDVLHGFLLAKDQSWDVCSLALCVIANIAGLFPYCF